MRIFKNKTSLVLFAILTMAIMVIICYIIDDLQNSKLKKEKQLSQFNKTIEDFPCNSRDKSFNQSTLYEKLEKDKFNLIDFLITCSSISIDEAMVEKLKIELRKTFSSESKIYLNFKDCTLYEIFKFFYSGEFFKTSALNNLINIESMNDDIDTGSLESINFKLANLAVHFISVLCDELKAKCEKYKPKVY